MYIYHSLVFKNKSYIYKVYVAYHRVTEITNITEMLEIILLTLQKNLNKN